jgi:hypothetical protein
MMKKSTNQFSVLRALDCISSIEKLASYWDYRTHEAGRSDQQPAVATEQLNPG